MENVKHAFDKFLPHVCHWIDDNDNVNKHSLSALIIIITSTPLLLIMIIMIIMTMSSADGNFEVTLATKATLYSEGRVEWKPPAIYHSSCEVSIIIMIMITMIYDDDNDDDNNDKNDRPGDDGTLRSV